MKPHQIIENNGDTHYTEQDFLHGLTPWIEHGLHEDLPGANTGLDPHSLGGLQKPDSLRKWTYIQNPVVPIREGVIQETLVALHKPSSATLH